MRTGRLDSAQVVANGVGLAPLHLGDASFATRCGGVRHIVHPGVFESMRCVATRSAHAPLSMIGKVP